MWAVKKWHQVEWVDKIQPLSIVDYCPFGQPGDRLWVRETFAHEPGVGTVYRADRGPRPKWTPSIHMPRSLSRITLEITDIRVERVQDITGDGARAEGVTWADPVQIGGHPFETTMKLDARNEFRHLWNDIYAKRGLSWDANPWVWAITFRQVKRENGYCN